MCLTAHLKCSHYTLMTEEVRGSWQVLFSVHTGVLRYHRHDRPQVKYTITYQQRSFGERKISATCKGGRDLQYKTRDKLHSIYITTHKKSHVTQSEIFFINIRVHASLCLFGRDSNIQLCCAYCSTVEYIPVCFPLIFLDPEQYCFSFFHLNYCRESVEYFLLFWGKKVQHFHMLQ